MTGCNGYNDGHCFYAHCFACKILTKRAAERHEHRGIMGFLMKVNTPPKAEKYSVIIEMIVPGTAAAVAGEGASQVSCSWCAAEKLVLRLLELAV